MRDLLNRVRFNFSHYSPKGFLKTLRGWGIRMENYKPKSVLVDCEIHSDGSVVATDSRFLGDWK